MNMIALILLVIGALTVVAGVLVLVFSRRSDVEQGSTETGATGWSDWAGYDAPGGERSRPGVVVGALLTGLGVLLVASGGVALAAASGDERTAVAGQEATDPSAPGAEPTSDSETSSATSESASATNEVPAGPGTECGLVQPPYGDPAQVRVERGSLDCTEALRVVQKYYDLPADPGGGNTAPQEFEGWRCVTATAGPASERGYGTSCLRGDTQLVVPVDADSGAAVRNPVQGQREGSRSAADLGLATPMTRPSCDGRGIVVLYSAVTPGAYAAEIRTALANNAGAKYLRTDESCPSLRSRDDNGNAIYAVYRESGYSKAELCADVATAPGGAYGRWLDTTSDPTVLVSC